MHTQLASLAQGVTKWMRTHIAFMSSIKRLIHSQSRVQLDTEKLYPLERDIQTLQMRCVGRGSSSSSSSSVLHLCTALTLVVGGLGDNATTGSSLEAWSSHWAGPASRYVQALQAAVGRACLSTLSLS